MSQSSVLDTVNVILSCFTRAVFRTKDVGIKNRAAADFVVVQAHLSGRKAQMHCFLSRLYTDSEGPSTKIVRRVVQHSNMALWLVSVAFEIDSRSLMPFDIMRGHCAGAMAISRQLRGRQRPIEMPIDG